MRFGDEVRGRVFAHTLIPTGSKTPGTAYQPQDLSSQIVIGALLESDASSRPQSTAFRGRTLHHQLLLRHSPPPMCRDTEQVGRGWLNPTEEAVWPLAETLDVAQLAFEGLNTHTDTEYLGSDDGECMENCRLEACFLWQKRLCALISNNLKYLRHVTRAYIAHDTRQHTRYTLGGRWTWLNTGSCRSRAWLLSRWTCSQLAAEGLQRTGHLPLGRWSTPSRRQIS